VADFVGSMNFLAGTLIAPDAVKVAGLALACPVQEGLAVGRSVQLCIRPEDVRVRELPGDAANRIAVEVVELEFAGAFCRATLKARTADGITLNADFSSNLVRDFDVGPGRQFDVALPPDRLRVFTA
jgi:iron(III) transport system ATP-binding protein